MKFSFRHVFNLIVVGLLGIYVVTAWGYNPQARLMPLIVSIPILILAIVQTINDYRAIRPKTRVPTEARTITNEKEVMEKGKFKKEVNSFLWAVSLFIAIYLFGFVLTTLLYSFLALKVRARFAWRPSLFVSLGCFAFLWVVMVYGLRVDLYPGVVVLVLRKAFYGY
jgi:predicted permease